MRNKGLGANWTRSIIEYYIYTIYYYIVYSASPPEVALFWNLVGRYLRPQTFSRHNQTQAIHSPEPRFGQEILSTAVAFLECLSA